MTTDQQQRRCCFSCADAQEAGNRASENPARGAASAQDSPRQHHLSRFPVRLVKLCQTLSSGTVWCLQPPSARRRPSPLTTKSLEPWFHYPFTPCNLRSCSIHAWHFPPSPLLRSPTTLLITYRGKLLSALLADCSTPTSVRCIHPLALQSALQR